MSEENTIKKFLTFDGLVNIINNIKTNFSSINHNHVVSDINDFPFIPSKTSELINDSELITSSTINNIRVITQSEYDSLSTPDLFTLYIIES